jgi:hypothetical protein
MYQVSTVRWADVVVFRLCSDTDPDLRVRLRCPALPLQPLIMNERHVHL